MTWDPELYVRGNYFQNEVNEIFRKSFTEEPAGDVLDVGCGDGQYTHFLAQTMKKAQILAIDSSEDMIEHATAHWSEKNLAFAVQNIDTFDQPESYDFILSFFCLHWTKIEKSFFNIYNALKPGGKLYAVFSSFSDNSIAQVFQIMAKQDRYKEFMAPRIVAINKFQNYFYRAINVLNQVPFKKANLELKTMTVAFPNIDYFKSLILTMPFIKTIPDDRVDEILEEMLAIFQTICQHKYAGKLHYETRPIFLEAIK